jgi:hypothetical protein
MPTVVGPPAPTTAVALYFPNIPAGRSFLLPTAFSNLGQSLRPGDTVRVLLGWPWRQDEPVALGIIRNGGVLLDTAIVLRMQRQRSGRTSILGAPIAVVGSVVLTRRRREMPAPAGAT